MHWSLSSCRWLVLVALYACGGFAESQLVAQETWPQFRGVNARGVGSGTPPVTWDVTTNQNIRWKTPIEGLGHSAPIVFDDKIYLTTAISADNPDPSLQTGWLGGTGKAAEDTGTWTWQVICLDRSTGKKLWAKSVAEGEPIIKRHLKASHANCTPATDGKHVVAFFGSEGLFCLDTEGNLIWEHDFGRLHSGPYNSELLEWGFASSPIIYDGKVIVQCDCLNTKFVAVLDVADGQELMRIDRDDVATWSTPSIVEFNDVTQLVCNGYKQMAGYDLSNGEQLWTLSGGGDVPVPTPLFSDGTIFLTNGHGRTPTYAISPDARGDITPTRDSDEIPDGLLWWEQKGGAYMPTPIIVDELLYTCNDNGVLYVRNTKTGEEIYKTRVGKLGAYSASAVATNERLYFSCETGIINVVKTGNEFELIAENDMLENVMATPAIVDNQLFIRTVKEIYCIEHEPDE